MRCLQALLGCLSRPTSSWVTDMSSQYLIYLVIIPPITGILESSRVNRMSSQYLIYLVIIPSITFILRSSWVNQMFCQYVIYLVIIPTIIGILGMPHVSHKLLGQSDVFPETSISGHNCIYYSHSWDALCAPQAAGLMKCPPSI